MRDVTVDDPMAIDRDDADETLRRRCAWVSAPGVGDVFARCVGDSADPLVLWVHGSGPANSSHFWADAMCELARVGAARGKHFFQVGGARERENERRSILQLFGAFGNDVRVQRAHVCVLSVLSQVLTNVCGV